MRKATVPDDLPWTPLSALSRRLATGATSSLEIVEACLARIDALDGKRHAYVDVYRDDAIAGAKAADLQRNAGLARVPCTACRSRSRTSCTSKAARLPPARNR